MCRMVHAFLECSIEVGESLGRAGESHSFAEVIAALLALVAVAAHDAALDCDALAESEVGDSGAEGGDDPGSFVAEDERGADGKVAVATVCVVVEV